MRNSVTGLLRYGISVPILLVTTPYILHRLGPEKYGIWALFGVVTAYAELSDLGIASGLIRFVAMAFAQQDEPAINRAASTVLITYLAFGGAVAAIILVLARLITTHVFGVPIVLDSEATFVVSGAAIAFFIALIFGVFSSIVQGLQRLEVWNAILVVYSVLDAAGSVAALALGFGLRGLVLSRIGVVLAIGLLNYVAAHRILPTLRCRPANADFTMGKVLVSYSLNILVSKLATAAREPLNKIILVRMVSLTAVSQFDLSARLANQARGVFAAMLIPLLPAASGIETTGGRVATRRLFYRATRYVALAAFPVFSGLIVFAGPIIYFWIGPGYDAVTRTMQELLIAFFFTLLASPAFTIMEGIGLARISATTSVIASLFNVGLSVGLGMKFGYSGVVVGYCLSMFVFAVVVMALFHHNLSVPLGEFLHSLPLRALLLDCVAMMLVGWILTRMDTPSLLGIVLLGAGYAALCVLVIFISRSLDEQELAAIKNWLALRKTVGIHLW